MKKYGPNERTDQNSRKTKQQRVANISDTEFKTLVIRMLTEMIEFGHKTAEEVKAMQNEKKEYIENQQ